MNKYITSEEYNTLTENCIIPSIGEDNKVNYTKLGNPELSEDIKVKEDGQGS